MPGAIMTFDEHSEFTILASLTEGDLDQAAANGTLEETHYLDLKRELPTGTSAIKDIAKDIAAFSEDGGLTIIGVDEETSPRV